jgi:Fe-S-cluster containining protein
MPVTELCEACGLCCNGTLYTHVVLTEDDVVALKQHPQVAVEVRDHQPAIAQGCAQHDGSGCRIYGQRPAACARYYCSLAEAVKYDDLSLPEGLAIVAEARALVDNATEYAPPEPGRPLAVATWDDPPPGLPHEGRQAWERAKAYLVRHFLGPPPT